MDVFDLVAKIKLDISEYENGLDQASNTTSGFGSKLSSGLGKVAKVAGAAMVAASGAIVKFGKDSVETGKDFDVSMSQVQATMLKTAEEMKSEVGTAFITTSDGVKNFSGNLREFAQFLGSNTAWSATQAADALNYMALAGYDTQQSMDMLPNVLNLASAGAMDLALASDMVTDTQTAFGLNAERTTKMVDEMAKAASTGNTNVQQLGEAFLVVGGLAQELNGGMVDLADGTQQSVDGVTEMTIAMTAMANAGIKGSAAGTHMRNMIMKLSSPTSDGAEQMEKLGVKVFDAEGNMRSLKDIMGDLNGALGTLTQKEKIQAISDLFNARDLASAEALLKAVGEDWDAIGESILDAEGASAKMANIQLENLEGKITLFKSALEGAQIAVSDKLTPTLMEFVEFGTDGITQLTEAFQSDGLTGAADKLGSIVADGASKISKKLPLLLSAGKSLIKSLVKGITSALPSIIEMLPEMFDTFLDLIFSTVDMILAELPTIIDTLASKIPEMIDTLIDKIVEYLPKIIDGLVSVVVSIAENASTIIQAIIDKLPDIISDIIGALIESLPSIIEGLISLIILITTKTPEIIASLLAKIPEIVTEVVDTIVEHWPEFVQAVKDILDKMNEKITAWGKEIWEKITTWWNEKVQVVKDAWEKIKQFFVDIFNHVKDWITDINQSITDFFVGIWNDISEWFTGLIDDVVQWLVDITTGLREWRDEKLQAISDFFVNIWNTVTKWFSDLWDKVTGWFSDTWAGIQGYIDKALEWGRALPSNIWNGITEKISWLWGQISGWFSGLWQKIDNKIQTAKDFGKNLVTGMWNGITEKATWLWNKITGWLSGIWDGIKNFFGIHSPSKQMAWAGQMLAEGLAGGIDDYADDAIESALDMAQGINDAIDLGGTSMTVSYADRYSQDNPEFNYLISAFKEALSEMRIELDDEEVGQFVDRTVTRLVYNY